MNNRETTCPDGLADRKARALGLPFTPALVAGALGCDPPNSEPGDVIDDHPPVDPAPVETSAPTGLGVIRHACPSCGDATAPPVCEACVEDEPHPLAPAALPYDAACELAYGLAKIITAAVHVVRVSGGFRVFDADDVAAGYAERSAIVLTADAAHVGAL